MQRAEQTKQQPDSQYLNSWEWKQIEKDNITGKAAPEPTQASEIRKSDPV